MNTTNTIEVDGRFGEGGGQILRTSLSLSALTGRAFRITHIRGNRRKPGLRAQHLAAVKLAASLCNAEVSSVEVGSQELTFRPKAICAGLHEVNVGTAGAVPLLTQAALVPALAAPGPIELVLTGGTDVSLAPTLDYIQFVTLPYFEDFGKIDIKVERRGFFPAGGGRVRLAISEQNLKREPLILKSDGNELRTFASVTAAAALRDARVCERISDTVYEQLRIRPRTSYDPSDSVNVALTIWGQSGNIRVGACALGEKRLSSEKLALRVCQEFSKRAKQSDAVEENLADQLIPILALRGGRMTCQNLSLHCSTNIEICKLFTSTDFSVQDLTISATTGER